MMNKSKNRQLRKRIVRVFKENNYNTLSTNEIKDKLSVQRTEGGIKQYSRQPAIARLSNILKFYPEFKRCDDYTATGGNGSTFKMATWKLTDKAEVLL